MSIGVKKVHFNLTFSRILIILRYMEENKLFLQKNVYWIFLLGFFLIIFQHINVIPPWFIPTDWGKAFCFRIILSIMIFLFACQIILRKIDLNIVKAKIKSVSPSSYVLLSLWGIYFLATIFSLNIHISLWDSPIRNGGFINFSFYIIFAFLAFLAIKSKDWQKLWDFSIIIGILVCAVAIMQQLGLFSYYLLAVESRPMSTMANAIFLSIYLLLIAFPSLSFGFSSKSLFKKIFYFSSFSLFAIVIVLLSQTRGSIIGISAASLWFLFAYPKKIRKFKISALIAVVFMLLSMYSFKVYLDSHLESYKKMPPIISSSVDRTLSIFEGLKISQARTSAWEVSLNALKERPILGYGPENFKIGFNKYYDPALPVIGPDANSEGTAIAEWFDRAHNIIFDVSVSAGIPALIIYLLFFIVIFWQLEKAKKRNNENAVILNGIQAAIIGYIASLLFGFDSVSTYLAFFFLVGYAFYLISAPFANERNTGKNYQNILYKYKQLIIISSFIILVLFIWSYNLVPAQLVTKMNLASVYAEKRCDKAIELVYQATDKNNIADYYLRDQSIKVIYSCSLQKTSKKPEDLHLKAIEILEANVQKYPQYAEKWLMLGDYLNVLIEEKNKLTGNVFKSTKESEELKNRANYAFEKALSLSPKRQILFREWSLTNLIIGNYKKAKELSKECINLNPYYYSCYWIMALANGYEGNYEEFNHYLDVLKEKDYDIENEAYLKQLSNMYIVNNDYKGLAETYPRLINITTDPLEKGQLYSSLAATYYELGEIKKAKESAQKILELIPLMPKDVQAQVKKDVEGFLEALK